MPAFRREEKMGRHPKQKPVPFTRNLIFKSYCYYPPNSPACHRDKESLDAVPHAVANGKHDGSELNGFRVMLMLFMQLIIYYN